MLLAWVVVIVLCVATFAFFLTAWESASRAVLPAPYARGAGGEGLSAKLDDELRPLPASSAPVDEGAAARAEPPAAELLALQEMQAIELELARLCTQKGLPREARIHESVAASIARRAEALERGTGASRVA